MSDDFGQEQAIRKLLPGKLVIASHNAGKVREIAALLGPYGIEPISAGALDLPEPEETGTTFIANAELKAMQAAEAAAQAAYNTGKTKSDVVEKALRATLETAQRDAADAKAAATNTRARFAKEIQTRDAAIKKASEEVSHTHLEAATLRGKLDATARSLDEERSENQLLRAQEVELRTQAEDLTARVYALNEAFVTCDSHEAAARPLQCCPNRRRRRS